MMARAGVAGVIWTEAWSEQPRESLVSKRLAALELSGSAITSAAPIVQALDPLSTPP